ncbi:hypothetical protein ACLB6G_07405 [Zhengella sp. ZM62]|uniref:hypothetical protein n=1 Tax=Zhengella sedimenti TaxID=3390035 RepID=UPI0039752B07
MLARRFTIVCLLAAALGSSLSILVAETARPARSWDAAVMPCLNVDGGLCR